MKYRKRPPITLIVGLLIWTVAHWLLVVDVQQRGGITAPFPPGTVLPREDTTLGYAGRWMAYNMTPVCWMAYLLVFDGILTWIAWLRRDASITPLRSRPNRYIVAWLTSIPVWCFFDWANFYFLDAWRYHGLPPHTAGRFLGYFVAFACISPGMFLAAQLAQQMGTRKIRIDDGRLRTITTWALSLGVVAIVTLAVLGILTMNSALRDSLPVGRAATCAIMLGPGLIVLGITRRLAPALVAFGAGFTAWAVVSHSGVGSMTLWVGLVFLVDPINRALGAPSLLADWQAGRLGRTFALMVGGAVCGLCWEGWNYYALAKWTYHLDFLDYLEQYRYFEMPLVGFQGFLPFALECWVVLELIIALLNRAGIRVAEPLPDDDAIF